MPVYTMDSLVDGVSLVRSVVGSVFWLLLLMLVGVDMMLSADEVLGFESPS